MLQSTKLSALLIALSLTPALAEQNGVLRIGVLNDMSSVYADFQGPGSVVAAQLAVEDFAKQSKRKVEVLSADHQNKPDVGSQHRAALDRHRRGRHDHRPAEFGGRTGGRRYRAREEQGGDRIGRRHRASDRGKVLAQYRALDLRHLGNGPWHCAAACSNKAAKPGSSSRPTMPSATISKSRRPMRSWPAAAKCSAPFGIPSPPTISHHSCCRRRRPARCGGVGQCRRRHRQHRQAGRRVQDRRRSRRLWR